MFRRYRNWYVVPWYYTLPEDGSYGPWGMAHYINRYMWYATVIDGLNDAAYVSANRASGADQAGDDACFWMQYSRTEYFLRVAGAYYQEGMATDLANFGWFFDTYWNPVVDLGSGSASLGDIMRQMSYSYSELSWYFQQ